MAFLLPELVEAVEEAATLGTEVLEGGEGVLALDVLEGADVVVDDGFETMEAVEESEALEGEAGVEAAESANAVQALLGSVRGFTQSLKSIVFNPYIKGFLKLTLIVIVLKDTICFIKKFGDKKKKTIVQTLLEIIILQKQCVKDIIRWITKNQKATIKLNDDDIPVVSLLSTRMQKITEELDKADDVVKKLRTKKRGDEKIYQKDFTATDFRSLLDVAIKLADLLSEMRKFVKEHARRYSIFDPLLDNLTPVMLEKIQDKLQHLAPVS